MPMKDIKYNHKNTQVIKKQPEKRKISMRQIKNKQQDDRLIPNYTNNHI